MDGPDEEEEHQKSKQTFQKKMDDSEKEVLGLKLGSIQNNP